MEKMENIEKIKLEIELLKRHLDKVENTLYSHEQFIDLATKHVESLLSEVLYNTINKDPLENIMKRAFSKGKIPNILLK